MPLTDIPDIAFADRHIGPDSAEQRRMPAEVGFDSVDALIDTAVPATIRTHAPLALPAARSEAHVLADLRRIAAANTSHVQMIGLGYYDTITPPVLRRNMLESPAWYTSYTPYQPEISQGRLEALLTFQTMVAELSGLPVAGASLLDEATAVVEAVLLMRRATKAPGAVALDTECFPQTVAVVTGRAAAVGIEVIHADLSHGLPPGEYFGVVAQNPGTSGAIRDLGPSSAPPTNAAHWSPWPPTCWPAPCSPHPETRAPTSPSARPNASGFQCSSAVRTPASSPCATDCTGCCPAGWSECRATATAPLPTDWPCRPANSTSAATRRPATSAPPRRCWPTSPPCTPSITAPTGWPRSPPGCTAAPPRSPPGSGPSASPSSVHDLSPADLLVPRGFSRGMGETAALTRPARVS